jgi:hypothetical protein
MSRKTEVFDWTNKALEAFRKSVGGVETFYTDVEIRTILDAVVEAQKIRLVIDLANSQIEELIKINDVKWHVIDALMAGDDEGALKLLTQMSAVLRKSASSELLKSKEIQQVSNIIQFRRPK